MVQPKLRASVGSDGAYTRAVTVGVPEPVVHNPKWVTVPPAGIVPPQLGAVTVTTRPSTVVVPLQEELIVTPAGSVMRAPQVETGELELFVTARV